MGNNYHKKLSHSQMEHGQCLHRYKVGYLDKKVQLVSGPGVVKGKFKHQVVADYVKYCVLNKRQGDVDKITELFNKYYASMHVPEEFQKELFDELMDFGAKSMHYENVLDIEKHFQVEVAPDMILTGIIDITRVYHDENIGEDVLNIIDYKNQANILPYDEIPTQQLKLYTIPIFLMYPGFKYFRRGIYYLKYNFIQQEPEPVSRLDIEVEIDQTKEMFIRQFNRIKKATSYPAETGKQCHQYGGCIFLRDKICPKLNEIGKNKPSTVEDKVRKIREYKLLAKALETEVKENLKSDSIIVDDKEVGYTLSSDIKYNLKQFVELANKFDIDFSELTVSKTGAEKLIKEFKRTTGAYDIDDFEKRIVDMVIEKMITKFKGL